MPRLRDVSTQLILLLSSLGVIIAGTTPGACAGTPDCTMNSDCPEGYCLQGECVEECASTELDCPDGYFCNTDLGQCQKGSGGSGTGGGTGGSGGSTSSGDGGTSSGTGGTTSTSSGTGGAGAASGTGQELDLCGTDGDCISSLSCKAMVKSGTKRCTLPCSSNAQCMAGTRCIDDGTGQYCLGDDSGRPCTEPSLCNYGCITGPGYCTAPCSSGSDCPNGWGCMPVGNPATHVCVRAEALCEQGNTASCVVPAACDLSSTLILGSCTLACNSAADCPQRAVPLAPWSCDGLCRRPADVFGPLPGGYQPTEWHCDYNSNPVVLCNDAQHIDFVGFTIPPAPSVNCQSPTTIQGASNDACVNSCRYQGGCAYGFACVAVGSVSSQRIGLCLPTGMTEPGQACTSNTSCAFGYCSNGVCSRDCTVDGICPGGLSCVAGGAPAVEGMAFRRCE